MNCPKCGEEMLRLTKHSIYEHTKYICRNEECCGWFCFTCDEWHSYGSTCSVAQVHGNDVNSQEDYDKWCKKHKEDIFRMLKDSGYYRCDREWNWR